MGFKIRVQTHDEDAQMLKMGVNSQFILQDDQDDAQLIFKLGDPVSYNVIIGGEYDTSDFNGIRLTAYMMQNLSTVLTATSCTFSIYKVNQPGWTESLLYSTSGTVQGNNYFFADITDSNLTVTPDGDPTFLVEASIVRQGTTYKNRVYLNQLGIYGSLFKVKQDVEFLAITKKDE